MAYLSFAYNSWTLQTFVASHLDKPTYDRSLPEWKPYWNLERRIDIHLATLHLLLVSLLSNLPDSNLRLYPHSLRSPHRCHPLESQGSSHALHPAFSPLHLYLLPDSLFTWQPFVFSWKGQHLISTIPLASLPWSLPYLHLLSRLLWSLNHHHWHPALAAELASPSTSVGYAPCSLVQYLSSSASHQSNTRLTVAYTYDMGWSPLYPQVRCQVWLLWQLDNPACAPSVQRPVY